MSDPKVAWPHGESAAYRALWAEYVDVSGERTLLKFALLKLVKAERRFTVDTGILLNDPISDACQEADDLLKRIDAAQHRQQEEK